MLKLIISYNFSEVFYTIFMYFTLEMYFISTSEFRKQKHFFFNSPLYTDVTSFNWTRMDDMIGKGDCPMSIFS